MGKGAPEWRDVVTARARGSLKSMTQEQESFWYNEEGEEAEYARYMADVRERLADLSGDPEWLKVPLHQIPWHNGESAETHAKFLLDDQGFEPKHLM